LNWGIEDLQSTALPLGYVTSYINYNINLVKSKG
jgi:hypothetical protein